MPLIPPTLRRLAPRGGQGVRNAWCERDAPALEVGRMLVLNDAALLA